MEKVTTCSEQRKKNHHFQFLYTHYPDLQVPKAGFGIFWTTLGYFGPLWGILGHFGVFWATLGYFGPLRGILGHFGVFWATLGYFGPFAKKVGYFGPLP